MAARLEALARAAVAGDATALAELCRELESPVFRLCLRMLGGRAEAEDAAQDILIKVVTHLGSFGERSALLTWVHQIAVRHVLSMTQSRAEAKGVEEEEFAKLLERGLAYGANPSTPESELLVREVRMSCAQGMLLMLTRDERLALVLVDLLGFDGPEAAEISGVAPPAFRKRLSRARSRLTAFLQEHCGVVNQRAACRCEKQVPAKRALGLSETQLTYVPLRVAGAESPAHRVAAELRALREVDQLFSSDGPLMAPDTLRMRIENLLPSVLGA